jgi:hypothetical protein
LDNQADPLAVRNSYLNGWVTPTENGNEGTASLRSLRRHVLFAWRIVGKIAATTTYAGSLYMNVHVFALVIAMIHGVEPTDRGEEPTEQAAKALWNARYQQAAEEYKLFREPESDRLLLHDKPVYRWNHAGQTGGASGSIFVWAHAGCPEAVACFWRMKHGDGTSTLGHELHSLSPQVLKVVRDGSEKWRPTAGLKRTTFDDAPAPALKLAARLAQMRSLAADFSAHGVNAAGDRRELRLLTTPVYRYQSTDPDVLDGALFAMVCTVGTDPEVFLLVECRRTGEGPRWHYAVARFSHLNLFVSYRAREVWSAVRGENDTFGQNRDQTYRSFHVPVASEPPQEAPNAAALQ